MTAKSSENCALNISKRGKGFINCDRPDNEPCVHSSFWIRNPHLWLDILPEQEGWYWWRKTKTSRPVILKVKNHDGVLKALRGYVGYSYVDLNVLGGELQGPIRPEGE